MVDSLEWTLIPERKEPRKVVNSFRLLNSGLLARRASPSRIGPFAHILRYGQREKTYLLA
jgi:hypothetical protein